MAPKPLPYAIPLLLLAACAAPPRERPRGPVPLAAIEGHWVERRHVGFTEEIWAAPAKGGTVGFGREVLHGALVFFEYLRIEERDGRLVYVAQPRGNPPAAFPLARNDDGEWVFEDPARAFPRRIVYRWESADEVVAIVEGTSDGQPARQEYRYRRER